MPKKNFALRVDAEVFSALEKWAADEFRSTNGQIEYLLAEALKKARRYPKQTTNEAANPREKKEQASSHE
ncbi:MAG: DNA-binding protein [Bacteroidales bacterium]|nr:DNA-binding protein [Bacteroidales bacterium]